MKVLLPTSIVLMISLLASCSPNLLTAPTPGATASPYATPTPHATRGHDATSTGMPSLVVNPAQVGNVSLHPTFNPSDLSSNAFDLDQNHAQSPQASDLRIDVSTNSNGLVFAAIAPINAASAMYLRTVPANDAGGVQESVFGDCLKNIDNFLHGSEPIGVGDLFCWKTNGGHLAALVIESASRSASGSFEVEIRYLVWSQVVK